MGFGFGWRKGLCQPGFPSHAIASTPPMTQPRFAQVIHEHQLFDVPKIIDLCVIYGDANRNTVTKIVHSVFKHQPLFKAQRGGERTTANGQRDPTKRPA